MSTTIRPCSCATCGHEFVAGRVAPKTCTTCGGATKNYAIAISVDSAVDVGLRVAAFSKTKRPKKPGESRKPFFEQRDEYELYKKDGKVYRMLRIIDYMKDWYYKRYTDKKTGRITHEVSHCLSEEHQGHGSAKKKT